MADLSKRLNQITRINMRRETRGRPYRKIPVYRTEYRDKLGKLKVFIGYIKVQASKYEMQRYSAPVVSSFAPCYNVSGVGTVNMNDRVALPIIVKRKDNPQAWHNRQVEQARRKNVA